MTAALTTTHAELHLRRKKKLTLTHMLTHVPRAQANDKPPWPCEDLGTFCPTSAGLSWNSVRA